MLLISAATYDILINVTIIVQTQTDAFLCCEGSPLPFLSLGARKLAEVAIGRVGTPLALFNQERLYAAAAWRFGQKWKQDSSDEDEDDMPAAKRDLRLRKFVSSTGDSEARSCSCRSATRRVTRLGRRHQRPGQCQVRHT